MNNPVDVLQIIKDARAILAGFTEFSQSGYDSAPEPSSEADYEIDKVQWALLSASDALAELIEATKEFHAAVIADVDSEKQWDRVDSALTRVGGAA